MIGQIFAILAQTNIILERLSALRGANLDNLDAPISTISPVRSVQRGLLTFGAGVSTVTATIAAVDTGKTTVRNNGFTAVAGSTPEDYGVTIELTGPTTITGNRNGTGNGVSVAWEALELK